MVNQDREDFFPKSILFGKEEVSENWKWTRTWNRWGPSTCQSNVPLLVTAYVSLDNESSGITTPPDSLQCKNFKLLKKMMLMRPQNVLLMRELPRSTQMRW
jgi:hypothetical protein